MTTPCRLVCNDGEVIDAHTILESKPSWTGWLRSPAEEVTDGRAAFRLDHYTETGMPVYLEVA